MEFQPICFSSFHTDAQQFSIWWPLFPITEREQHTLGGSYETSMRMKSCVRAVEGFTAGNPTVLQLSLPKSWVLLLTSDFHQMALETVMVSRVTVFLGLTQGPSTPLRCFLDQVQLSFPMENIYLYLVSPPDPPASVFCYCIFINNGGKNPTLFVIAIWISQLQ